MHFVHQAGREGNLRVGTDGDHPLKWIDLIHDFPYMNEDGDAVLVVIKSLSLVHGAETWEVKQWIQKLNSRLVDHLDVAP